MTGSIASPAPTTAGDGLQERVEAAVEGLRILMLEQPITDDRDTYSDGFGQGLALAIDRIRAALA